MPDIIDLFAVRYDGRDADSHALETESFGESIIGSAKLYAAMAHYAVIGTVPKPRAKKNSPVSPDLHY